MKQRQLGSDVDLIAIANATKLRLNGTFERVVEVAAECDLFICIWLSENEIGSVERMIVKGIDILHRIKQSGVAETIQIGCAWAPDQDHAEALACLLKRSLP